MKAWCHAFSGVVLKSDSLDWIAMTLCTAIALVKINCNSVD